MGVYLATVFCPPSGVNAGVGVQQFLNEHDGQTDGESERDKTEQKERN